MTHFELFGLAPSVDVDVAALEAKHRALALEHHPDRQADPKLRRAAADTTASLNEALKVLRDPVKRAFYLLTPNRRPNLPSPSPPMPAGMSVAKR